MSDFRQLGVVLLFVLGPTVGCSGASEQQKEQEIKDAEWHYKMGSGYFDNHKVHRAMQHLNKALEKDPEMAKAHFLLGFIYSGRKKYHEAVQHYKKALDLKSDYHQAKNNLGSVYLSMERWEDAAKIFRELIDTSMYPTPELAHNNLGWAQYNMGKYKRAIDHFEKAVFLKPEMCLAYNNLGLAHEARGDFSEAADRYREAIRKCPTNYPEPHFNLAKILQRRGNPTAQKHFEKCAEKAGETTLAERCSEYLRVR